MDKRIINRKNAPASDAPYSPAIACGSFIFVSGQVPIDPGTGAIISADFGEQAEQCFQNLRAILEEAGSSLEKVVKTTAFLTNLDDFGKLNEAYKRHFPKERPARSCIEASRLPLGARVEIEAIAVI
ncbi:MAG: RidA family protein [Dehalococcoidia bacterium]|nr:RidA family protein [Dehalococcoidia bacterium]